MNRSLSGTGKHVGFLLVLFLVLTTAPSFAVNLAAIEQTWMPPDGGASVRMWGFVEDPGSCATLPNSWLPGPTQQGVVNGTFSITLRNCLSEPISLIIPGLETSLTPQTFVDAKGRTRVRAFTHEVPADNGATVVTYTWNNLRAGTYLYQSGSHPARQVPMGLYGALTVGKDPAATRDLLLLFSEIDPALHGNAEAANTKNYKPKYYLINGQSALPGTAPPVTGGGRNQQTLQLRFLNAGLMTHVPTIQGPYMQLIAEDGYRYPYPREQYSVLLPAGKTIDALWRPDAKASFALYDRRLSMTTNGTPGGGMLVSINVAKKFPWILYVPPIIHGGVVLP